MAGGNLGERAPGLFGACMSGMINLVARGVRCVRQLERLLSSPVGYVTDIPLSVGREFFFGEKERFFFKLFWNLLKNISNNGRVESSKRINENFVYSYNIFQFRYCSLHSKWSLEFWYRSNKMDFFNLARNLVDAREGSLVRSLRGGEVTMTVILCKEASGLPVARGSYAQLRGRRGAINLTRGVLLSSANPSQQG